MLKNVNNNYYKVIRNNDRNLSSIFNIASFKNNGTIDFVVINYMN
jgi:hypothetical protein